MKKEIYTSSGKLYIIKNDIKALKNYTYITNERVKKFGK